MSTITVFRVDTRQFAALQVFASAGKFQFQNPNGEKLEDHFEAERPPNKPRRIGSLFLFENLADAERHWGKLKDGILYECLIETNSILHRGDMQLVDVAGAEIAAGLDAVPSIAKYWRGEATEKPRWELLATQAVISKLISADQEKRKEKLLGRAPERNHAAEAMAKFRAGLNKK